MNALLPALAPLWLLGGGVLLLMLAVSIRRRAWVAQLLTALTLGLARWLASVAAVDGAHPLLVIDPITRLAWQVLLATALGLLSLLAVRPSDGPPAEEALMLLLLATLGACALAAASHWATVFLGVELVSVAAFGLVAYSAAGAGRQRLPLEAGIKYLVTSAAASATLAMGLALVYAATGSLQLLVPGPLDGLAAVGMALVLGGVAVKLSLAPLHWWTADVYQGAPMAATAMLATLAKAGLLVVVLRLGTQTGAATLAGGLAFLAMASMVLGNVLALRSPKVKRVLAYSSIAHLGYVLAAVAVLPAGTGWAADAVLFYLPAYLATTVLAFAALWLVGDKPAVDETDLRGLFWHRPWVAAALGLALLSLAGVPLTSGFVAKFAVLSAAVTAGAWWLTLGVVLGSALGLYYYLRLVFAMTQSNANPPKAPSTAWWPVVGCLASALAVLGLGVAPGPLLTVIEFATQALVR